MKKLTAVLMVAALLSGCATAPSNYGNVERGTTSERSTNGQYDSTSSTGERSSTSASPFSSEKPFWTGTTIFWTIVGIALVGVAAKKSSDKTCHTGSRGGTYTVTANGNKNYSGC